MAWTSKPYCTVDDVKLVYDKRTATDDDLIQSFITTAQEQIDTFVGFPFQTDGTVATPATRTYDGNGAEQLLIDRCLSLVSVQWQTYTFGTDPATGAVTRTANPPIDITAAVVLGPPNTSPSYLLQHLIDHFELGKRNYVVTGVFGFATVPQPVKRACELEVIAMLDARNRGYRRQMAGPGGTNAGMVKPDDLCAEAQTLLGRYKRVRYRMN
jgi:hypothetical protein